MASPFGDADVVLNDDFPCAVAVLSPQGNVVTAQLRARDVERFLGLIVTVCEEDGRQPGASAVPEASQDQEQLAIAHLREGINSEGTWLPSAQCCSLRNLLIAADSAISHQHHRGIWPLDRFDTERLISRLRRAS